MIRRGLSSHKQYKHENDLFSLSNSDASFTDLSLKGKSNTATTSISASSYDKSSSGIASSNESAKNLDDGSTSESSGADNVNSSGMVLKLGSIPQIKPRDADDDSQSPTPVVTSPNSANFLPIQKLSIANMKAHDLEQANLKLASLKYPAVKSVDEFSNCPASSLKFTVPKKRKKKARKGKKKCTLPVVASSLGRQFPLPNPKEIELYSLKEDAVHLDPRSNEITSSSPSSTGAEL